jgi:cell division transport system ATP-binding protein
MNPNVIDIQNASIFQQNHSLILSEVNLNIQKGDFCYLIGRTGSGKSSLLKTLYGELPLLQGEASIADFELYGLPKQKIPFLRRKIGIVFQDFQLLTDRNVEDNLMFVLKATGWKDTKKKKRRIEEVLGMVGLGAKDYKMPHELSGGEQQRVVIARALLNDPEIILADEPTGNLDPDVSDEIMSLLKLISEKGTAVFMATHDYRLINKFPGKIFQTKNGQVKQVDSAL